MYLRLTTLTKTLPQMSFYLYFIAIFISLWGSTHDSADCWSAHRSSAARDIFKRVHDWCKAGWRRPGAPPQQKCWLRRWVWLHRRRFRLQSDELTSRWSCGHVGSVAISCPGGAPSIHDCSCISCSVWFRLVSRASSITKDRRDLIRDLGDSRMISLTGTPSVSCWAFLYSCRVARSRRICGDSMLLSTYSKLIWVSLRAPDMVHIAILSCVSMCWTWAHHPHTGTQYSATEYTRAIADVRSTGAGAPQPVLASLLMMLQRDFTLSCTFSVCFMYVSDRSRVIRGTSVQSRVQTLLPLLSLSVFWQPVRCPGEPRSPLSSLGLGVASSGQSTRSDVNMSLIVWQGSRDEHIQTSATRLEWGHWCIRWRTSAQVRILGGDRYSRYAFGWLGCRGIPESFAG